MLKRATSGENWQALHNLTWTCLLPRVTAETHENGYVKGENVETGNVGRKQASVA
jgi:hypothetical protein